jgi:hypothetical protein
MRWVATTIARRLRDAAAEMRDATWSRLRASEIWKDPKRGASADLSVDGRGADANFAMARRHYASGVLHSLEIQPMHKVNAHKGLELGRRDHTAAGTKILSHACNNQSGGRLQFVGVKR